MNDSLKEKERIAIERLKAFEPDDDVYYGCYSGGKDSDCIRILLQLADVSHELHHNLTTVDAPETVRYVKSIPGIIINKATYKDGSPKTMWNLIPRKKLPPTRLMRYCCQEFKEQGGKGKLKVTGVRWAESIKRRDNGGVVKIIGKPKTVQQYMTENNVNFQSTKQGGVVLNLDNDESRRAVEHCYRTTTTMVNPIIDWTDADVWMFLNHYGCRSNPLYYCGEDRIGCIGCPLSGTRQQESDFRKYPKFRANYVRAFDRMLKARKDAGMTNKVNWTDGESVMRWWLGDTTDPNQLSFFDDEEMAGVMSEE